jgi:hypothetical protein
MNELDAGPQRAEAPATQEATVGEGETAAMAEGGAAGEGGTASEAAFTSEGPLPAVAGEGEAGSPTASELAFGGPQLSPLERSAGEERMGRADLDSQRLQPGLDDQTVAQRSSELKAVLGVDVNFQQLLEEAGQGNMRQTVERELPNIARMGFHTVRVNVPVHDPSRYEDYKQVLEGVQSYNAAHPEAPVKVDLLANPPVSDYSIEGASGQGQSCAAHVKSFIAYCGAGLVSQTVDAVELFNEPEAEWQDQSVGLDTAGAATRDSTVMNAGMGDLEGQLPDGVGVTAGAHEWDPASESDVLAQLAAQFGDQERGDPAALQAGAAAAIEGSSFGARLSQFAIDYRARRFSDRDPGEVVEIPIALHIYNSPLVSRGLMDAVAAIAARPDINCRFQTRVTEFQIDALAHNNPSPEQLADGIVSLGVQVMDAAAQHADRLQILQMIAFSYHHRLDAGATGTDFGLKDNAPLADTVQHA